MTTDNQIQMRQDWARVVREAIFFVAGQLVGQTRDNQILCRSGQVEDLKKSLKQFIKAAAPNHDHEVNFVIIQHEEDRVRCEVICELPENIQIEELAKHANAIYERVSSWKWSPG